MSKKTVIVTGFEPCTGIILNPSWEAVKLLPEMNLEAGDIDLITQEVPVLYKVVEEQVKAL